VISIALEDASGHGQHLDALPVVVTLAGVATRGHAWPP
jgi:hypothetical protein